MRALRPLALYSLACLGSSSPSPRSFPTLQRCVRTSYACSCACGLTCGLRVRRQTFRYCLTQRAHALLPLGICRAARCPLLELHGQWKRSLIWLTGLEAEIQFDIHLCRRTSAAVPLAAVACAAQLHARGGGNFASGRRLHPTLSSARARFLQLTTDCDLASEVCARFFQ